VVVTRAAEQNQELVAKLEEKGAVALVLPMVAFMPPDDPSLLDEAVRNVRNYDWVFVTSYNPWRAMRERCWMSNTLPRDVFSGVKIAVVGPASADAVIKDGLSVAYVARKHQGTALAEELAGEVRGKRVLLPRSDRANPDLVESLKRLGADVTEVCAYKTVRPQTSEKVAAMTEEADAVLFFSPSAAQHLEELLGRQKFQELSRRSMFTAIGPVTEAALRHTGVERVLRSSDTLVTAIVETLEKHFEQNCVAGRGDTKPRVDMPR